MKVNRVTLSAFGTTGVLLAASLTMLAIVSALVTFNAWPTRDGSATTNAVAVERAPQARLVRAVRRSVAVGGAAATRRAGGTSAALAAARGGSATGGGGTGATIAGGGQTGSGGLHGTVIVPAGPTPQVAQAPPGEGDPGPGIPPPRSAPPGPVHGVVCGTASGRLSGVGNVVGC
jgi:hypothetical protein